MLVWLVAEQGTGASAKRASRMALAVSSTGPTEEEGPGVCVGEPSCTTAGEGGREQHVCPPGAASGFGAPAASPVGCRVGIRRVQATGLHPQACWRTELSPEESGHGGGRMKRGADKADSGRCSRTVKEGTSRLTAGKNIPG